MFIPSAQVGPITAQPVVSFKPSNQPSLRDLCAWPEYIILLVATLNAIYRSTRQISMTPTSTRTELPSLMTIHRTLKFALR